MANHSSATARRETPHAKHKTRTATIIDALKRRAEAVLNDTSIDAESRAIIRYAMEVNDPWLAKLVRRVDAGETVVDSVDFSREPENNQDDYGKTKSAALAEIICEAGDEAGKKWAALAILMATIEQDTHPKQLANTMKHLAFTRCGDLNFDSMVDTQIELLERELLTNNLVVS